MSGRIFRPLIFQPFRVFPRVGQAVDPHFDPHFFQHFYNKKAPKTEVFDASWSCWADSNRRPHPYQEIKCSPDVAAQGVVGIFTAKRMRSETLCPMCSVRSFPRVGHGVGQSHRHRRCGSTFSGYVSRMGGKCGSCGESGEGVLGNTGVLLLLFRPSDKGHCLDKKRSFLLLRNSGCQITGKYQTELRVGHTILGGQ